MKLVRITKNYYVADFQKVLQTLVPFSWQQQSLKRLLRRWKILKAIAVDSLFCSCFEGDAWVFMQRERLGNLQAQNRRNTAQIYAMQQEISRLASGIGKRFSKFSTDHLLLVGQTKYSIWCFFQVRGKAQMRAVCLNYHRFVLEYLINNLQKMARRTWAHCGSRSMHCPTAIRRIVSR